MREQPAPGERHAERRPALELHARVGLERAVGLPGDALRREAQRRLGLEACRHFGLAERPAHQLFTGHPLGEGKLQRSVEADIPGNARASVEHRRRDVRDARALRIDPHRPAIDRHRRGQHFQHCADLARRDHGVVVGLLRTIEAQCEAIEGYLRAPRDRNDLLALQQRQPFGQRHARAAGSGGDSLQVELRGDPGEGRRAERSRYVLQRVAGARGTHRAALHAHRHGKRLERRVQVARRDHGLEIRLRRLVERERQALEFHLRRPARRGDLLQLQPRQPLLDGQRRAARAGSQFHVLEINLGGQAGHSGPADRTVHAGDDDALRRHGDARRARLDLPGQRVEPDGRVRFRDVDLRLPGLLESRARLERDFSFHRNRKLQPGKLEVGDFRRRAGGKVGVLQARLRGHALPPVRGGAELELHGLVAGAAACADLAQKEAVGELESATARRRWPAAARCACSASACSGRARSR